jgi:hypothetical protein
MLVVRAIDGLGFNNVSGDVPRAAGARVALSGPLGNVELAVTRLGVIELRAHGRIVLRLVPLADRVSRGGATAIEALANDLRRGPVGVRTVVLYPGDSDDRAQLDVRLGVSLNSLGNDSTSESNAAIGMLPVTPLELDSAERVTRAVRWALAEAFINEYPPQFPIETDASSALESRSWCRVDGHDVVVIRPPRSDELADAERAIAEIVRRDAATAAARRAGARSFSRTSASLAEAVAELAPLLSCPVCLQAILPSWGIEPRDDDTFWVTCPSCSNEWGSQRCGACAARFPVIRRRFEADVTAESIDNEFGGDVLAIPCWRRTRENTYICPHCGECGDASNAALTGDCRRCCGE